MNILITGGTGFIGSRLVQALAAERHTIIVLSRSDKRGNNPYISYRKWDGRQIPPAIGFFDVIINLAGASIADKPWTEAYKQVIKESRIQATQACVEYINTSSRTPSLFISASAVGYYGGKTEGANKTESDPPGTDFLAEVSQAWEQTALAAKCRTIIPRIGVVLGNEGGAFPILRKVYSLMLGATLGDGSQPFPWIHITDLVQAFLYIIHHERLQGPVNLVSPGIVSQKVFNDQLGKAMHRPAVFWAPKFLLELGLGERSVLFLGGQGVAPTVLQTEGFAFRYSELDKALADLITK